jgi:hypothetical protein
VTGEIDYRIYEGGVYTLYTHRKRERMKASKVEAKTVALGNAALARESEVSTALPLPSGPSLSPLNCEHMATPFGASAQWPHTFFSPGSPWLRQAAVGL